MNTNMNTEPSLREQVDARAHANGGDQSGALEELLRESEKRYSPSRVASSAPIDETIGAAIAATETPPPSPIENIGTLAGEAILKQCEEVADSIEQVGEDAVELAHKIRRTSEALAERLRAKAGNLQGMIADFSAIGEKLDNLAQQQSALLAAFDPMRKESGGTT